MVAWHGGMVWWHGMSIYNDQMHLIVEEQIAERTLAKLENESEQV